MGEIRAPYMCNEGYNSRQSSGAHSYHCVHRFNSRQSSGAHSYHCVHRFNSRQSSAAHSYHCVHRFNSRQSSAAHSYHCVHRFRVCKQWSGCQCLGFVTCEQVLMHAIFQTSGYADTVRESALKAHRFSQAPLFSRRTCVLIKPVLGVCPESLAFLQENGCL